MPAETPRKPRKTRAKPVPGNFPGTNPGAQTRQETETPIKLNVKPPLPERPAELTQWLAALSVDEQAEVAKLRAALPAQYFSFALEYLRHFDAPKAAAAVGFSVRVAQGHAKRLLDDARIARLIELLQNARAAEAIVTYNEALQILSDCARADMATVVDLQRRLMLGEDVRNARGSRACKVVRISESAKGTMETRVELVDKVAAIRTLADMSGWGSKARGAGGSNVLVQILNEIDAGEQTAVCAPKDAKRLAQTLAAQGDKVDFTA